MARSPAPCARERGAPRGHREDAAAAARPVVVGPIDPLAESVARANREVPSTSMSKCGMSIVSPSSRKVLPGPKAARLRPSPFRERRHPGAGRRARASSWTFWGGRVEARQLLEPRSVRSSAKSSSLRGACSAPSGACAERTRLAPRARCARGAGVRDVDPGEGRLEHELAVSRCVAIGRGGRGGWRRAARSTAAARRDAGGRDSSPAVFTATWEPETRSPRSSETSAETPCSRSSQADLRVGRQQPADRASRPASPPRAAGARWPSRAASCRRSGGRASPVS